MNPLDNASIVSLFAQGGKTLVANQQLRIEPAFDAVQLLAKRGGLIASIKLDEKPLKASLRRDSEFWELVNRGLLEQCFMPLGPEGGFYRYEKRSIPSGYQMHMAEARLLWREWWRTTRQPQTSKMQMNLLLPVRSTWYPIRQITACHEMLFITTLTNEVQVSPNDLIVWLSQIPESKADANPLVTASSAEAKTEQAENKLGEPLPLTKPASTLSHHRFRRNLVGTDPKARV